MNPAFLFVLQFVWFLVVWFTIAKIVVDPLIERFDTNGKLSIYLLPQLFRVLGIGLLVQNLAPDLPTSFALPTAIGDSLTAILALIAIIALHKGWPSARTLALICNVVGTVDLAIALPHAAITQATTYLTGQWYVPAAIVPLMIVSHVMIWRTIFQDRAQSAARTSNQ